MSRRGRSGNPVSLFAFQDIITSVTGIMLLVTLFLALELIHRRAGSPDNQTRALTAEMQQAAMQAAAVQTTVAAILRETAELRVAMAQQESELTQDLRFDADELRSQLHSLETLNQMLSQELAESGSRRSAAAQSLDELKSHDAERTDDRQQLAELTREAEDKLRELQKLKQANRVIFNPGQGTEKTPWLVELTPQGILAAQTGRHGAPQSFPDVKSFLSWAGKRSRSGEYFVLLVKPSTIDDFHAARLGLERLGFDVGFDLLRIDQTAIDPLLGATSR